MKPNEILFPTMGNINNEIFYTQPMESQNYPLNALVDESIIYSCSKASWAPLRNISVSGMTRNSAISRNWIYNVPKPDFQLCSLSTGFKNMKNFSPLWAYTNRWGYDVNGTPPDMVAFRFINGFKYNSIWGILKLNIIDITTDRDTANVTSTVTYNDYMQNYDHDRYKIMNANMIVCGKSTGSKSINIVLISNQNLTYRMLMEPPSTTNEETIIPYFNLRIRNQYNIFPVLNSTFYQYPENNESQLISTGGQMIFGFMPDFCEHRYSGDPDDKHHFYYLISGYENLILAMAATYGIMFFVGDSASYPDSVNMTDPTVFDDLICPIPASDGTYNGDYIYTNNPNFSDTKPKTWIDSGDSDAPFSDGFKGVEKTDPNTYTDSIDLNTPTLSTLNVFNRSFAMNSTNIESLANFLWNADESIFNEIVNGLKLLGGNPISGIINLRLYPFDITTLITGGSSQEIVIGRTATGIQGIKLDNTTNAVINLGECTFFTNFKNFLDYEPYTVGQLYIPYIGVLPLSTAEFMGHRVSVKMVVDFVTGACTAIVYKDDIPYIYKNGVLGIDIPVTGDNAVSYSSNILSSIISGIDQATQTVQTFQNAPSKDSQRSAVGAKTGAVTGIIDSGLDILNNLNTVSYQVAGSASPACSTWLPQKCYFIVSRPVQNTPTNYGHAVGYKCSVAKKLSDCAGFTVVSNPDIQISGTLDEQSELMSLLTGGVYL